MAGTGPWSAVAFAQQHRLPIRLVREVITILAQARLLVEVAGAPEHYLPGRDPLQITPGHIIQVLRHAGDDTLALFIQQSASPASTLMDQVDAAIHQVADAHSMPYWLTVGGTAPMLRQADFDKEDDL
jgi:hypothetical protein